MTVFVTAVKTNTPIKTCKALALPSNTDQDIIKNKIIIRSSKILVETRSSEGQLGILHLYKPDENKVIDPVPTPLN